jgi:hypothetical protein
MMVNKLTSLFIGDWIMDIIEYWSNLKKALDKSLDIAIYRDNVDVETLKTMKEMLGKIRVKDKAGGVIDV